MNDVLIYTDGACSGNPGPGGYGVILSHGERKKEMSGGYRFTTSNRMEIMAVIVGLEALKKPCQVTIYSDSQYVANSISKGWLKNWEAHNWTKFHGSAVKNADLWRRIAALCKIHQVQVEWIRGHNGHPENERCDFMAVSASKQKGLLADEEYERIKT